MSVEYKTQIELQQQLEKAILTLNKKYAFDGKVVRNLAKDISETLFAEAGKDVREGTYPRISDEYDFDTALQKVAEILEKSIHDTNPATSFQILKAQVNLLASKTEGQPNLRRQMTALLATATRRINPVELNREQLRVLQEIVKQLKGDIEDFEDIMACEKLLEQVKIDVLPDLGYGAEVWARQVKDEDFFGDVNSDTALATHE